jgi:diguanylate cyclase (GGDEF)-like protein
MKESLLIIDDSANLHKLVRTYLENESFDIHSAFNGTEGIAAAAKLLPDLILLDLDMPDLDGFEVCRRLKKDPATQSLPILFLTGDVSVNKQIKGLDLGANDYMTKRFKPEELLARIRAALRAKPLLDESAMVDGVTKLWNRTYLDRHLPAQLSIARRHDRPLSCIMVEMDYFANVNKAFGESVGKDVLRCVAQILASHGRAEEPLCHLGDGKFIMLLPATLQPRAARLAEIARAEIEQQLKNRNGLQTNATCSFGVADTQSGSDSSLLDRADAALYSARRLGRNTVSSSH